MEPSELTCTVLLPVVMLADTAGDLPLAAWRRAPLEVLTVDGDGLQAAAMIDLVRLE